MTSPVPLQWETLYLELQLEKGAKLQIPKTTEERALYVLAGKIEISNTAYPPQQMLVLRPGKNVIISANAPTHLMVHGGAAMDGPRYMLWNFVSSSKERLHEARDQWQNDQFPKVPHDEDYEKEEDGKDERAIPEQSS